jgi:hypothetical protein
MGPAPSRHQHQGGLWESPTGTVGTIFPPFTSKNALRRTIPIRTWYLLKRRAVKYRAVYHRESAFTIQWVSIK